MGNRYSKILLIVVTILCVFMMSISYINSSFLKPVRNYAGFVLTPVQSAVSGCGTAIAAKIRENSHLHEVYEENQELKAQIDQLKEENNRLISETLELERLRELYQLDQDYQEYTCVAARVISRDSQKWFNIFRIDKGMADGIVKDMNVIAGGGLVGIVIETGANYSTVRSIIDDESNVYAQSRYSSDTCLVKGNLELFEEGTLEVTNINRNSTFNDGDAIITSNLSTKFLPGILIGYASDIKVNSQHLTKSGRLIPAASFDNLQEVLVITQIKTDNGIITPDKVQ